MDQVAEVLAFYWPERIAGEPVAGVGFVVCGGIADDLFDDLRRSQPRAWAAGDAERDGPGDGRRCEAGAGPAGIARGRIGFFRCRALCYRERRAIAHTRR